MAHNPYDKASRYAAKIDPTAFLPWLFDIRPQDIAFRRWLDTRALTMPGGLERISDTVAAVEEVSRDGLPWALAIEFQHTPDPSLFGRLLVYLGLLWLHQRPSPERGDRYCVGAVAVNLTGQGNAARQFSWPEARLDLTLTLVERNLAEENAGQTLTRIESGELGLVVLPWLALMQEADDEAFVQRWLDVARREPDSKRRSDYGSLALAFAEAAKRKPIWQEALKGWNMIQSELVQEWMAEGEAKGRAEGRAEGELNALRGVVIDLIQFRFGVVPDDLRAALATLQDVARLRLLHHQAIKTPSMEQFRQDNSL